jgi:CRP/FNR family transcriptional regulator
MSIRKSLSRSPSANCEACALRHGELCGHIPAEELRRLQAKAWQKLVFQGHDIFRDGDEVSSFATILSGVVKLTKTTRSGERHIIALMYPPDFLGFTFDAQHRHSAVAATEVELCLYPKTAFYRLLHRSPDVCRRVCELSLRELEFFRNWTLMLAFKSSHERVAGVLAMLARRATISNAAAADYRRGQFQLPLTRAELADLLGLTLETVSRNISKLKHKGLIELSSAREVIVPDVGLLMAEAELEC